tara:strand:- start:305 stop:1549 length:1245 start_codon:yes stop_codon:yes gene_type:complete
MNDKLALFGGRPVLSDPIDFAGHDFGEDDIEAISKVIKSGEIGNGPEVKAFENEYANRYGIKYGISVNSGTSALHTCVAAMNPDPGDEIITTAWTSGGSIIGLLFQNCVPVFADIDDSYCLDPSDVERKITSRTKAILVVNLMGNMSNVRTLREIADRHNIFLIEDCCQSHFAEDNGIIAGSIADISGFSFGGKHLNLGGGGMVLTNNKTLWERAILFRDAALPRDDGPAEGKPYANQFLAPNYKMNDIMAAMGRNQLKKVDGYVQSKIKSAKNIIDGLRTIKEITPQKVRDGVTHTYWSLSFTIDTAILNCTATEYAEAVSAEGIPTSGPYLLTPEIGPLNKNPFLSKPDLYGKSKFPLDYNREIQVNYKETKLPYGNQLMSRNVNFDMTPSYDDNYIEKVIEAHHKVVNHYR